METDENLEKKPDSGKGCLVLVACFFGLPIALVLIVYVGSLLWGDESNNDEGQAIVACESKVRDGLKAPRSADFRSSASKDADKRWTVTGTVDAQNSFGATIRNEFRCAVGVSGDYAVAKITSWQ